MKRTLILLLLATTASAGNEVRAIIGEASGEGYQGMLAVAGVIRNRGHLRGIYGVNAKHVDREPAYVWRMAEKAWRQSATNDITRGATHFENVKAFGTPRWSRTMTITTNIGRHTFFKP
jgi:spore germination cell wall hydrolase CwlJ-like protein